MQGVQGVERLIVCTPLRVNVFVTLVTHQHLEYNCKALFETPCRLLLTLFSHSCLCLLSASSCKIFGLNSYCHVYSSRFPCELRNFFPILTSYNLTTLTLDKVPRYATLSTSCCFHSVQFSNRETENVSLAVALWPRIYKAFSSNLCGNTDYTELSSSWSATSFCR
jgi:hypothetical protein